MKIFQRVTAYARNEKAGGEGWESGAGMEDGEMTDGKISDNEKRVCSFLDGLGIGYEIHRHEAVYTVDEVVATGNMLPGMNVKNLVIKDKRTDSHYLVIVDDFRRLDFKHFAEVTGWSKKARFADEEDLEKYLGLTRGSCSLFGIINDTEDHVKVVLGSEVHTAAPGEIINFHPNDNTVTLSITIADMFRFLDSMGNEVILEPPEEQA